MENNINFNTNKTAAGFNTEKMAADAISELVWNAGNNLSTATSLLIQAYPIGHKKAEAVQKQLELQRKILNQIWQFVDKELRGIKTED